ncbi:MAG: thioesterase family protein [Burkholderiales bacterium]
MSDTNAPIFSKTLRLRWGEMDAMQHLNNVAYFRYFEEARISWFYSLGFPGHGDTEGPVLGRIACRFVKPALYPATVAIDLYAGRVGTASFDLSHVMRDADDPSVRYAEGDAGLVWIDIASGKSRPIPPGIRAALQT